ncbi:MAG: hypothetical protein NTX93_06635 [Bacteroidia bacterium]|nr:hypothetical protein [Bacteroidia bacterium]
MKKAIFTIGLFYGALTSYAQIDSVSFSKSRNAEIKTINIEGKTINRTRSKTSGESTLYLSLSEKCNYILPKYSQLTDGVTTFKKVKSNAQASLSALGSSLSVERKSEFYVYSFKRTKTFSCLEDTSEIRVSYGVGVYVILKISDLKIKIDIKTPYDIAAVGQLGLAKVELDVRHFGMTPTLATEFLPSSLGKIDIEAAKYFDRLLENTKTKINDINTIPTLLPVEL